MAFPCADNPAGFMRPLIFALLALPFAPSLKASPDPNAKIPADCPELQVHREAVPEAQNAYAILTKLKRPPRQTDYRPDRAESFLDLHYYWIHKTNTVRPSGIIIAKAKTLLNRHAETMRTWDEAMAAPAFQEPLVNSYADIGPATTGNNFGAIREAVFGNLWRIRVATYEGRDKDAFDDWYRLRNALLRQANQSDTILATMIRSVELNLVNQEAWLLNPTAENARRTRMAARIEFPLDSYRRTVRSEARFGVMALPETDAEIENYIPWAFHKFEENGVKTAADYRKKILPLIGDIAVRAREVRDEIRRLEMGDFFTPASFKDRLAKDSPYIRRNRALHPFRLEGVNIFDLVYFANWADAIGCAQSDLAMALRAYAAEHEGKYPETLDTLVPRYADAIPNDPFDGKPMRYESKTPKLWSIGPDFTDDGGDLGIPPRRSEMAGDITSRPPWVKIPNPTNSTAK